MGLVRVVYDSRWLFVVAGLLGYVAYKVHVYNRLKAFKGPFSSGWFEFWHSYAIIGDNQHLKYKEVCEKYGPIARIGPNDLITSSRDVLTHMSAVRSPYSRVAWFHRSFRSGPEKNNLFSETNEEVHTRRRQQLAPGYSGRENAELEGTIDVYVAKLVHLIRSKYLSTAARSRAFDLGDRIQFFALDVINAIALGESLGDLDADADQHGYMRSVETGIKISRVCTALGILPLLQSPVIARRFAPSEKDDAGFGRVMRHARARILARLEQGTEHRSDMLASFVRHGLGTEELVAESILQMIAGSDTSSTAIRCAMLYVMTHPPVYARLQAEVDAAAAGGSVPPVPGVVSDAVVKGLPYLQAVVKEAMRVHPPTTGLFPKRVPPGGDTVVVDGKPVFLPGGANVSYAYYATHHDKQLFGEDAEDFRPERWLLEKDETKLAAMLKTHELIFGYGRYQCLGKPIALMEIAKVVFEVS
ncbi:uncharacterized protein THITE_2049461 [Thermothielavioides terrestris NRRL 8126]|uniref:Cytochrome P450-like protein n=1 Tax=Thermothielavioides terrestris (strain ATCC 38088 / NRRL 8126) TaxID=578455 RepID=G2R8C2_THETT|nr:uncharacterized protein THITE_2049461 [Thermothielavioides terrestris NRRL 8126]AEO68180.1 hypothetical protein THITE_2049461 [Thermothielavioides terrestris NRRL 8126]